MTEFSRTIYLTKIANRAEIVRTHETTHDAWIKSGLSQQNQCRASARFIERNRIGGGGIYALPTGRACELDSYSTHDRTICLFSGQAA